MRTYFLASCCFAACFTLLLSWASPSASNAENRCLKYWPQVIREARYHIGMDAPAHEFMGQIETESGCKEGATAFDGGMGLGQFMPATAGWIHGKEDALRDLSMKPMPYNPRWSIRALILYDRWLYRNVDCQEWHYAYRAYNGGLETINNEIRTAGSCDHEKVEAACKRKVIIVKSGRLDMCRVNITYPAKIRQAGQKYTGAR